MRKMIPKFKKFPSCMYVFKQDLFLIVLSGVKKIKKMVSKPYQINIKLLRNVNTYDI